MPANPVIGYPIHSDPSIVANPSLGSGSWQLPLTNLQDRRTYKVARSTTAALADTRLHVYLAQAMRVGVLAVPKHTLSATAKYRFVGLNTDNWYLYYMAGMDMSTVPGATFTRSTGAYYSDQNGVLISVAANVPRDGHFISGRRVLLIEEQDSNNVLWSEDFTNAAWSKVNTTVTGAAVNAPDTTLTMGLLSEAATNTEHYVQQASSGWSNGAICTVSLYVRPQNTTGAQIRVAIVQKDGATVIGAIFNPITGAVLSTDGGVTTQVDAVAGAPGCFRFSCSMAVGTGASQPVMRIACTSNTTLVYAGSTSRGVCIWGANMGILPHVTSYIKSTTAAANRGAETLSFPVGSVQPTNSFTVYIKAINLTTNRGATYWWQIGTANPLLQFGGDNSSGNYVTTRFVDAGAGVHDAVGGSGAPHMNDTLEMASTFSAAGTTQSEYSLNGATATGSTSASFTAPGAWGGSQIVSLGGGNPGCFGLEGFRIGGPNTLAIYRGLIFDSGWLDAWPMVYPTGSIPANDPRALTGRYSLDEIANTPTSSLTVCLTTPTLMRRVDLQISDAANVAGYVDLGRLVVADALQPSVAPQPGAVKFEFQSESTSAPSDGATKFYLEKARRRMCSMLLSYVPADESFANYYELIMRLGTTRQFMFVYDPTDTYHMSRRSFLAVLNTLGAMDFPFTGKNNVPIAALEDL